MLFPHCPEGTLRLIEGKAEAHSASWLGIYRLPSELHLE